MGCWKGRRDFVMTTARQFTAGLCSALLSLLSAWLVYAGLEGAPGAVVLLAVALAGFCAGVGLGLVFGAAATMEVGLGAFLAALLLWTPVVLATYGFALIALPGLALFGWIVGQGARFSRRLAPRRV